MAILRTWTINFQIRKIGTATVLGNANITLQAEAYGPECVAFDSFMFGRRRASGVQVGDTFMTHRPEDGFIERAIQRVNPIKPVRCVQLLTESLASLRCARSTPFNLPGAQYDRQDGYWTRATWMKGRPVMVERNGVVRWEPVIDVIDIGEQLVVPMSFGGRSFAAGDDPTALIYSHNMAKQIR